MPNQTGAPEDYWASIRKRERKDGTFAHTVLAHLDGRQFPVTFDSDVHAEAFKSAVKAHGIHRALKMHDLEPVRRNEAAGAAPLTVAQWLRRHIDNLTGVEQYTLDVYERYLRLDISPILGDIPLKALAEEDIGMWVKAMEVTKSKKTGRVPAPKTIANRHGFLSGALGAAVTKGLIPANPAAGRRLPRTTGDASEADTEDDDMRMLSHADFDALVDACAEHYRPLLRFMVASGMRWGEVSALKPGDVDQEAHTVKIRRAWKYSSKGYHIGPVKTKRSRRTINVPSDVLAALDYTHKSLFVDELGRPIRYHLFKPQVWDRAVTKAKLDPKPTPHDLRHTTASWMLNAGVPLTTVSRHLGHESINITADTYGDVDRKSHEAAANVMAKLLGTVTVGPTAVMEPSAVVVRSVPISRR
jgi:integrase